ncbi:Thiol-disulfide isomerase or thioredoxin [Chitinophaga eiseniae]|uniref:Thiol-disulfide isomerase or thioredoxin n=1 Tax=Chitinophaga eiseniae TaxID=634771 RepID=A0A1T4SRH7_9BACT|nr:TlpA disulfide reductase family protein [Chitinophaga eiseniae]SKA30508.1 Thiol-disulfide isomerase or thioredoxin [Chitinophaga eiseniae]
MRRLLSFIIISLVAISTFAQENHPVSWKFSSTKIAPLTYQIKLHATVQEPYHIYPQGSAGGMGMPTEFLFDEDDHVEFVGEMEEKGDEQQGMESLTYYAKGVTFTQTLKLKSEKKTTLAFTIKYMACNNQMCLPPSKKHFTLELDDQGKEAATVKKEETRPSEKTVAFEYEDFKMADMDGNTIASKNITSKSKYTFIDFWASWCAPCRAQGRELIPIYNNYRSKGFDVIAVSLDTDVEAWKKATQADGYTWTNLSDLKGFESPISKRYNIIAIPRNLLIDRKGNIIAMDLHGKDLEAKLAELFKI